MKYYVVWNGRKPGIYTTWEECKAQVHKFKQAKYKSFPTKDAAEEAFSKPAEDYVTYSQQFYAKSKRKPFKLTDRKVNRKRKPLPKVEFPPWD